MRFRWLHHHHPLDALTTLERKPGRLLALYAPLVLGVITGVLTAPACECTWPKLLLVKSAGAIAGVALWWIVIIAGFHSYHFMKSLFHHPR
jgi:hypothetical protein